MPRTAYGRWMAVLLSLAATTAAALPPGLDSRPSNLSCIAPPRPNEGPIALQRVLSVEDKFYLAMMQAPNDPTRWFLLDRTGLVIEYVDGAQLTYKGVFLDITDRVDLTISEQGLLGMAFHPDFANNGQVFLYYSSPPTTERGAMRLSRFTSFDGGLTLDPTQEEVLLEMARHRRHHLGGGMAFGNDGYLYLSIGDVGERENGVSQNVNDLAGSMLRLDVDSNPSSYSIPLDNPFAGGGGLPEIYAWGFRNPWRWSFDRITGNLWLGDVGWHDREEINLVVKGGNYGWPIYEGTLCTNLFPCDDTGLSEPIVEYLHTGLDAVIGGYVYRGTEIAELSGAYVYANIDGKIFGLFDWDTQPSDQLLLRTGEYVLSFAEGLDQTLYLLTASGVFRIVAVDDDGQPFPEKLSETGCFVSTNPLVPAAGLIPYEVNQPLWSDGADKQRWLALPDGETIDIGADDDWDLPIGTVLIKNFQLGGQVIETRLFMRHDDDQWAGYSYEWDDNLSDATLLDEGKTKLINGQNWTYPSRSQCFNCHTDVAGGSLGLETGQMNRTFTYPSTGIAANQIETLAHIGMFAAALPDSVDNLTAYPELTDTGSSVEERARAYLHANCAMCHQPNGPGTGPADLRFSSSLTDTNTVNTAPTVGDLGIPDARLIAPGHPEKSVVSARIYATDANRMPPLATEIVDVAAATVIDDWIRSLPDVPDPCGQPSYDRHTDSGLYLWRACGTNTWKIRATAGASSSSLTYTGEIVTDGMFQNVTGVNIESRDTLQNTGSRVSFTLKTSAPWFDGFDFSFTGGDDVCLDANLPSGTQLRLGAQGTLVTTPFSLTTLMSCGDDPGPGPNDECGEPVVAPNAESGAFLWKDCAAGTGRWQLRAAAGGSGSALTYSGEIVASAGFSQVAGFDLEGRDLLDTSDPARIAYRLKMSAPWLDGIDFTPAGSDACFDMTLPAGTQLRLGSNKVPKSPPFDLFTLAACGSEPPPPPPPPPGDECGHPNYSAASEKGLLIWKDCNGANNRWHMRAIAGGSSAALTYTGEIVTSVPISVQGVNFEAADFVDTSDPLRTRFRMKMRSPWFDGVDLTIDPLIDACLQINLPAGTTAQLGAGRVPAALPLNLNHTAGACN